MSAPYKVIIVDDELISRGFMELLIKPSKEFQIIAAMPFAKDALKWCQDSETRISSSWMRNDSP